DLRAALVDGTGDASAVNDFFSHYVYGTAFIDDRVDAIDAHELLPPVGSFAEGGKRMLVTAAERGRGAAKAGSAAHDAGAKNGAPSWRSTVTVVRDGAAVPQLLRVHFADGSQRDVQWH